MKIKNSAFIKSAIKPSHYPEWDLPEVAFAGRSNVGKSSLINTLLMRKALVKVSRTPGRTQHINFFTVQLGDDRELSLVDLPGYGFARVPAKIKSEWGTMVDSYLGRRLLKALVIVMDVRRGMEDDDRQLIEALPHFGVQPILVFTKADKLSRNKAHQRLVEITRDLKISNDDLILFSSHTRKGREKLWERIAELCLPRLAPSVEPEQPVVEAGQEAKGA